jgi:hypothetical protein
MVGMWQQQAQRQVEQQQLPARSTSSWSSSSHMLDRTVQQPQLHVSASCRIV